MPIAITFWQVQALDLSEYLIRQSALRDEIESHFTVIQKKYPGRVRGHGLQDAFQCDVIIRSR